MIHYRVHNNRPLDPTLTHMNLVHNLISCYFKIHFNIIPLSMTVTVVQLHHIFKGFIN